MAETRFKLVPRRERLIRRDPVTDQPLLVDGNVQSVALIPDGRAVHWVTADGRELLVAYVETPPGRPINILPPTTVGLSRAEWDQWFVDELCAAVIAELGPRPCSLATGYTPEELGELDSEGGEE